jgi:DNA polymerase (family 10)
MKMSKGMTNLEIAELLRAVAAAYLLKGEEQNRFRIIAYQRAADAVEHASSELKDLWDEDMLDDIPGIGKSIAEHLDELFKSGSSKHFNDVMKGLPPQIFELMDVPGIGVKTAFRLSNEFKSKIRQESAITDLQKLAKKGEIEKLPGMGKDSQDAILKSIEELKGRTRRHLLPYATYLAHDLIEWLKVSKFVVRADALGSIRRKASTVGDVDVAAATDNPKLVIDHFTKYPKKTRVLEKGVRTASIIVPGNKQVDLMVESPDAYGALLQHFTGSKHHNIALREYALKKNLSLSDYGIYIKQKNGKTKKLKKIASEEEFYKFLGMDWIPPELREDKGEIKKALEHKLPNLVELYDIKGDLQIHSNFDIETSHDLGESTMEEIIDKANKLGYEYIAFTEHNPSKSKHNEKQIIDLLKRKKEKVEKLNKSLRKSLPAGKAGSSLRRVFNSLEIDMLPSGKLPVPKKGLELLDFALVSIHSSFRQSKDITTERVLSALSHPKVKIFAHPTGRMLGKREGVELDWDRIFEFCIKYNKWLEINAEPMRLDLPDFLVMDAVKYGVKLTLGTDSHHINGMDNMTYGVSVARRGWAEADDIVNTRGLKEFEKMIE